MTTADRFRAAVDSRDLAALDDLFTEDIRFYSPVKFTPFEGKPMVLGLFGVLLRTFEDFRYIGRYDGTAETSADGTESPSAGVQMEREPGPSLPAAVTTRMPRWAAMSAATVVTATSPFSCDGV